MAQLNFDASKVEPNGDFSDLPAADYICVISKSEMKNTKTGDGEFLSLAFDVIDGQYAGRKLFTNLNLVNKNTQTVEIAQKSLSSICRAVGVLTPKDSEELHDRPIKVTVKYKEKNGKQEQQLYFSKADSTASAPPVAQAAAANRKPWQRAA